MRKAIINLCLLTIIGCSQEQQQPQPEVIKWESGLAKDSMTEKGKYLNLEQHQMEWSKNRNGIGFLYYSKPGTNDKVWSFSSDSPITQQETSIKVKDGDIIKASHKSGKSFEIEIIKQANGIIEFKYKSI